MKFILKDYQKPSIYIPESGYLYPVVKIDEKSTYNHIKTHHAGIDYIPGEYNDMYFSEANTVIRINNNEDGYFDFNKAILDIGANVGCYSLTTNFKHIYAFEPNIYIYHILCVNLMLHDKFDIADIYNVILSDRTEDIEYDGAHAFLKDQQNVFFNDFSKDEDQTRYVKTIQSHMIDEYALDNIGLIKIDVEGMEEKILRGALGTIIRNNYPPILFECWEVGENGMTQEKRDSISYFLESYGYRILWYWGDHETHLAIHE